MTSKIPLKKYLEDQEKLPQQSWLSEERIFLLKFAEKCGADVFREKNSWFLEFDEGAYQGKSVVKIPNQHLTPIAIANALHSVGSHIDVNDAIMNHFKNYLQKIIKESV